MGGPRAWEVFLVVLREEGLTSPAMALTQTCLPMGQLVPRPELLWGSFCPLSLLRTQRQRHRVGTPPSKAKWRVNLRPVPARGLPSASLGSWGPSLSCRPISCPFCLLPPPGSCQDGSAQSRPTVRRPGHCPGHSVSIQEPGVSGLWPRARSGVSKPSGPGWAGRIAPSCCSVPRPSPARLSPRQYPPCPPPLARLAAGPPRAGPGSHLLPTAAATQRGPCERAASGQCLPAHPGLRAPWRGQEGGCPGRGARSQPGRPHPSQPLCQRPMDERVGRAQEESSPPGAPSWGVSGRHPSPASLCSPDLRPLAAKTWAVDAGAAPGIILLLPGHVLRKGPSGAPLGTGTKLTGPDLCPHWEAWVHLAWDTGFRGSEWCCYRREGGVGNLSGILRTIPQWFLGKTRQLL